jgi:hypothetical protein
MDVNLPRKKGKTCCSNSRTDRKRSGLPACFSEAQPTLEAILGLGLTGQKIDLRVGELVKVHIRWIGGVSNPLISPARAMIGVQTRPVVDWKVDIPTVILFAFRTVRTQLPSIVVGPVRPCVRIYKRCQTVSIALSHSILVLPAPLGTQPDVLSFAAALLMANSRSYT